MQPDARGRRPTGKDSHEMVVQVHQNPNWDSAGTIHGPGEAVAPVCWGPHRWDAARRPVLEAKSQVYEPTRPSTEPEFSPLLLLRNHQMLATTRPRCATRMPRVRTPYGQPVPLQPDPANVLGTLSSEPCLTMASRVTLVHRGAQLDVPRSHKPSAHQLQTPITLFVQLQTRLCLFTTWISALVACL